MTSYRTALIALLATAPLSLAMAQSSPSQNQTTSQDQTAPSAASSPHQRNTTSTPSTEAPATNGADPSAASTPHQHQAASGGDKSKMMKDCVTKEQAKDSSVTKDQAKKTCKDQMKSSDSTSR